jgi:hypothetical protein
MSVGIVTILYHEATVKETFVLNSLVILWGLWMVVKERERKLEMRCTASCWRSIGSVFSSVSGTTGAANPPSASTLSIYWAGTRGFDEV